MNKMVKGDSSSPCASPWISAQSPMLSSDLSSLYLLWVKGTAASCLAARHRLGKLNCSVYRKGMFPVAIHLSSDKLPSRTAVKSKKKDGIKKEIKFCVFYCNFR